MTFTFLVFGALAWAAGNHEKPVPASGGEPVPAGVYRCDADELERVRNRAADAQPVLAECLAAAPEGSRVELPPGKYTLESPLHLVRGVTLVTRGKKEKDPPCSGEAGDCAVLAAGPGFLAQGGIVSVRANGVRLDHLVIDGQGEERHELTYDYCRGLKGEPGEKPNPQGKFHTKTSYGFNLTVHGDDVRVTGSVIQNALCGTGVEVSGKRHTIVFRGNRIRNNGVHDTELLWADGVTVHDASNSVFEDNEFHDNTDVDFIFGGCQKCSIARNKITHGERWARSSYVGLMLHAWPTTSGDYRGSVIEGNRVDCGPKQNCGFGIYIGSSAWYKAKPVVGGTFKGNSVSNAQTGLVLDDVHDMEIGENDVDKSGGGTFETSGGRRFSPAIVMTSKARVTLAGNPPRPRPEQYTRVEVEGAVPNWHSNTHLAGQPPVCVDGKRHPFPHYGVKEGRCLKSCGALGGTISQKQPCAATGTADAGRAYDADFCCR